MRDPDSYLTAEGFIQWLAMLVISLAVFGVLGLTLFVSAGWMP